MAIPLTIQVPLEAPSCAVFLARARKRNSAHSFSFLVRDSRSLVLVGRYQGVFGDAISFQDKQVEREQENMCMVRVLRRVHSK